MNYYDARQTRLEGRWDYTQMRDKAVWPIGYCGEAGGGHHATEAEARECYKRWLLERDLDLNVQLGRDTKRRCTAPDGCEEFTDKAASWGPGRMEYAVLCDAHRNAEVVAQIIGTVGSSTSSY